MQLYLFISLLFLLSMWSWVVFCGEEFESLPQGFIVLGLLSAVSLIWPLLLILIAFALLSNE